MESSNQLDMLDTIEAITTSMFHHVRYSIIRVVRRVLGSIILVQLYIIIKIARTCIVLSEHDANGKKFVYVGTSTYRNRLPIMSIIGAHCATYMLDIIICYAL